MTLYVAHHHEYSGAETLMVPVIAADPDALLACPPGSETERLFRDAGIETVPLSSRVLRHSGGPVELLRSVGRGIAGALELRRLLRAHPERRVVCGIAIRPGMLASVAALGLRREVVWYVPDFFPPWPVRALALALARLTAERVVAISGCVAEDIRGLPVATMSTVRPGLDATRFDPSRARPGEPRAAVLGHVSPTKRTDLAIDIAALVAAEEPDFELAVVGRAQFRDEDFEFERALHERVASDPRLKDRVSFPGYSRDVATALAGLGLLLHTRDDEPFGMVLLEAMAAGLPVVAPRSAGPAEIVLDGETGFLYEPGDAADAAAAVLRLLRDRELAMRLGAAGRRHVIEHYDAATQSAALAGAVTGGTHGRSA